jgi:hypothetical protein
MGAGSEVARTVAGAAPGRADVSITPGTPGKEASATSGAAAPPSAVDRVKAYAGERVTSAQLEYEVAADGSFVPVSATASFPPISRASDPAGYGRLAAVLFRRPPSASRAPAPTPLPDAPAAGTALQCAPAAAPPIAPAPVEDEAVKAVNLVWALRMTAHEQPHDPSVDARPTATRAMGHAMRRDNPSAVGASELLAAENRFLAAFEARAYEIALAQLAANERIALAEAGRYGELDCGDPTTEASHLRRAATDLAAVQTQLLAHVAEVNGHMAAVGGLQAQVTADNLDEYLDTPILQTDAHWRALRLQYDALRRIYGPAYPILLRKGTDYAALAAADGPQLATHVAGATGDVLAKILKTRAKLTPEKVWSLLPVVELTKRAMGIEANSYAQVLVDRRVAGAALEATFVQMALGALGLLMALAAIAITASSGGAAAPVGAAALATADALSSLALAGAGLGVYTAVEQYAEYDFKHAAAGASLDPVTALSAEDPSLAWLIVAIAGAVLDVGAAVLAYRSLSAIARATKTYEELVALERAAAAQASVLKQQGKLAGSEQEFVKRVMSSAEAKLAAKGKKPPIGSSLDDEVAATERAYAEATKEPAAILPNGKPIKPTGYGGGFHCPREQVPPDVAFKEGLPARGGDMRLKQHTMPGSEGPDTVSGMRGTTPQPTAPGDTADAYQGAVHWGTEGEWVYQIDGVPTWDLAQALEGRLPLPDGSFGGKLHTIAELEGAIPARVPPERIARAGQIGRADNGRLYVKTWIENPNYKPRVPK